MADATYIEPITWRTVARIIEQERPDVLLPTMGGQTALNAAMALHADGTARWWELSAPRTRSTLRVDHGLAFLGRRLATGTSLLDLPREGPGDARRLARPEPRKNAIGQQPST